MAMDMRQHAAPNVLRGHVTVVKDGAVVVDRQLADLVRTDRERAAKVDIYVNADDVEAFRVRWSECGAEKRRLN
jgi:hypothetical protein